MEDVFDSDLHYVLRLKNDSEVLCGNFATHCNKLFTFNLTSFANLSKNKKVS